jgi:hypothetical protein
MPNQAKGYWRKKSVRISPSGMRKRVKLREPSAPMTKSHSRLCCSPSWVKRIVGRSPSMPSTLVSVTTNRTSPPSATRRAIRSLSTSCWA